REGGPGVEANGPRSHGRPGAAHHEFARPDVGTAGVGVSGGVLEGKIAVSRLVDLAIALGDRGAEGAENGLRVAAEPGSVVDDKVTAELDAVAAAVGLENNPGAVAGDDLVAVVVGSDGHVRCRGAESLGPQGHLSVDGDGLVLLRKDDT